jgi:tetratricopeptide (TPR) repeat protein
MAATVAALLDPGAFAFDPADEAARSGVAALRRRLADRLGGSHGDLVAVLGQPELPDEARKGASEALTAALAVDTALAADLSQMLAEAEEPGRPAGSWLALLRAMNLAICERHDAALAVHDEILRREPATSAARFTALYWSAVSLGALERRAEALARLHRARAMDVADAEDLIHLAQQFLLHGERAAATDAAAAATALSEATPPSASSTFDLGVVWAELGHPERALGALESLLTTDGAPPSETEVSAHLMAAKLLLEDAQVPDPARVVSILTRLEQRLGSFSEQPQARMWLGVALAQLGQHAEALEQLDEQLPDQMAPVRRAGALFWRGVALLETGDAAEAEPVLRAAVGLLQEAEQRDAAAHAELTLAISFLAQQRRPEARAILDRLDAALGQTADATLRGRVALWRAVAWNDDEDTFREGLRRADELLPPDVAERGLLAFQQARLLQTDDPERALTLLDSIASPHPAWLPFMAITRAVALATLERAAEAVTVLEPLVDDAEALPREQRAVVQTMLGDLLLRSGRPGEALTALTAVDDAALTDDGLLDWLLGLRARAAAALNRRDLLEAVIDRVVQRNPSMAPLAALLRAETLMASGDLSEAFASFRALEEPEDASNALAWVIAAQARQLAERSDVEDALERAVELDPSFGSHPLVQLTRAMAAVNRGDVETIEVYGAQATAPDERVLYRSLRAGALRAAERLDEAIRELEAVEAEAQQATSPLSMTLHAQALAQKALLLVQQNDDTGAERAVAEAEDLVDALPAGGMAALVTRLARGVLHLCREEHREADTALAAVGPLDALPASVSFVVDYLRGMNWRFAGSEAAEDALRWLASAVRRKPDDADALSALGEVHLMLEDPVAAVGLFERALPLVGDASQKAAVLRDKAGAECKLGRLETAVETARQATTLEPHEARNWLSLGATQLDLGRYRAAAIAFRRGWRMRPRPPDHVATQLVLGLTKALLDSKEGAAEALQVLDEPEASRLAEKEPLIERNRAVALLQQERRREAIDALRRSGRTEIADDLAAALTQRRSWLGFWFGGEVPVSRRVLGALLLLAALVALVPVVVNPTQAQWLGWIADGNVRPIAPVVVVLLLFLLPLMTRIKLGNFELEQPTATAPTVTDVHAASWDAVERTIEKSLKMAAVQARVTGALSGTGAELASAASSADVPVAAAAASS